MKVLILGGTRFLGRHLVTAALAGNHDVTIFNRGVTDPKDHPNVETIHGDRETNIDKLSGRSWDVVIDTCGYFPRITGISTRALFNSTAAYTFISSISVYADFSRAGMTEDSPVGSLGDQTVEEITPENYGPLKALCEETVRSAFPLGALILRPSLIVGPYDPTDRFTYWPVRVTMGGEILAPDKPQTPVQFIDARDLAAFAIHAAENKITGTYNVTGPQTPLDFETLLNTCKQASGSDARFTWAPLKFLSSHGVSPWSDLPVWAPSSPTDAGFMQISNAKAVAAGLTFHPLSETILDTLAWAATRQAEYEWRAGLDTDREAKLLKLLSAWQQTRLKTFHA